MIKIRGSTSPDGEEYVSLNDIIALLSRDIAGFADDNEPVNAYILDLQRRLLKLGKE
jgi:hypothetical protein